MAPLNLIGRHARLGRIDDVRKSRARCFGVVGPKQVNITRRNQLCRTRGNGAERDSGRSYPASVQALGMDSGPSRPLGRPDHRRYRASHGGLSNLAASPFPSHVPVSVPRPCLRPASLFPSRVPVSVLSEGLQKTIGRS